MMMSKKMKIVIAITGVIITILTTFAVFYCWNNYCCNVEGIEPSYLLLTLSNMDDYDYDYCASLNKALEGDLLALKRLTLFRFSDGATYDHGIVLLEVIDRIGEKKYLEAVKDFSKKEKKTIDRYLNAGLNFSQNPKFQSQRIDLIFPQVNAFLKSKE